MSLFRSIIERASRAAVADTIAAAKIAAAAVAFALVAGRVQAQVSVPSAARYAVTGSIVDIDERPITNAEVRVETRSKRVLRITQSDTAGRFAAERLDDVPSVIHVRAFGYAPREVAVSVSSTTHRASLTVRLEETAAKLSGVDVTTTRPDSDAKLAAYRERRGSNSFAHFVDGDEIAQRKPQFVSEMLRPIGGVTVTASDKLGNVVRIRGCAPLVWVDGVRMPGVQLDEVAPPDDVAAIEIYNSFAGIPSRYFDRTATCGTILVWLRS